MKVDIEQTAHPANISTTFTPTLPTESSSDQFLIPRLFARNKIFLTYHHADRLIAGGAMPDGTTLPLASPREIGSAHHLGQREMGIVNIGGPGRVHLDGAIFETAPRDCLYVGMGTSDVRFESTEATNPAKFYLVSTPAHRRFDNVKISIEQALPIHLGAPSTSHEHMIRQYIHPTLCNSCQLLLGMTEVESDDTWNFMPTSLYSGRSEIHLYFDMPPEARVLHVVGEPKKMGHLAVANEQAVISPGWSIRSSVGAQSYSFIWATCRDANH